MAYKMRGCSYNDDKNKNKNKKKKKKNEFGAYNYPGGPNNPFVDEMSVVNKPKPKSPKKPKR
jgi:hypothetical protein